MEMIDFKKVYKAFYSPKPGKPEIVTLPEMLYVMVDGQGDPNTSIDFQNAIGALYSVVYSLKFWRKKSSLTPDYSVGPLEALWSVKSGETFATSPKKDWLWTAMLWLPDFISDKDVKNQTELARAKKPNPALNKVYLKKFNEGTAVQIMHIGPYGEEQPNIELMHDYALQQGYQLHGKHHEIYLGDPRRAAPEKLRTILRQPIRKIS